MKWLCTFGKEVSVLRISFQKDDSLHSFHIFPPAKGRPRADVIPVAPSSKTPPENTYRTVSLRTSTSIGSDQLGQPSAPKAPHGVMHRVSAPSARLGTRPWVAGGSVGRRVGPGESPQRGHNVQSLSRRKMNALKRASLRWCQLY